SILDIPHALLHEIRGTWHAATENGVRFHCFEGAQLVLYRSIPWANNSDDFRIRGALISNNGARTANVCRIAKRIVDRHFVVVVRRRSLLFSCKEFIVRMFVLCSVVETGLSYLQPVPFCFLV